MNRQIIALGGGGFSMEPENPLLDRYILNASKLEKPRVCFVPTASGDSAGYVERFYASFNKLECEPSHLTLFNPHTWTEDLEPFLAQQDVLYFGGGNTKNALALWREWNLELLLRAAYERGAILAGLSAGAICWFEQGSTDSIGRELGVLPCLGWLKGSMTPHYDGEAERPPSYINSCSRGRFKMVLLPMMARHFTMSTRDLNWWSVPDRMLKHILSNFKLEKFWKRRSRHGF